MKLDLTDKPPKNWKAMQEWHAHFAILPRFFHEGNKLYFVWLEHVERKWMYISNPAKGWFQYRMPRENT